MYIYIYIIIYNIVYFYIFRYILIKPFVSKSVISNNDPKYAIHAFVSVSKQPNGSQDFGPTPSHRTSITAILIAEALPALPIFTVAAVDVAFTAYWSHGAAWVRRVGRGIFVGFPNVHLYATNAPRGIGFKLLMRTLSITIASAKLGTCMVSLAFSTLLVHFNEIDSSIHAAVHGFHINVQGELSVQKFEHLVLLPVLFGHIESGANIAALGHEVQLHAGHFVAFIDLVHTVVVDVASKHKRLVHLLAIYGINCSGL